jgi:hypothetical protein
MAKKRKRVKRVLGLKVPKPVGRFLASPAGQLTIAGVIVAGGVAAARSPRVRAAVAMAGHELKEAGVSAGYALGSAARAALTPVVGAAQQLSGGDDETPKKKKKRKSDSSPRLEQEDYEEMPH